MRVNSCYYGHINVRISSAHAQKPTCTAVYQLSGCLRRGLSIRVFSCPASLWNQGVQIIEVLQYWKYHALKFDVVYDQAIILAIPYRIFI